MNGPETTERAPSILDAPVFTVGTWRVEPALHVISNHAGSVRLEPRVMHLLVYLAAADGRVVPRSELLDKVWGDVVVNDEAVSRAVSELRKALGDSPKAPRYVQTIRKSGYRLLAEVSAAPGHPAQGGQQQVAAVEAAWDASPATGRRRAPLGVALVVLVTIAMFWWWADRRRTSVVSEPSVSAPAVSKSAVQAPSAPLVAQRLTAYPGREIDPAIDRPGERVVFAWNGAQSGDEYDLYVRRVGAVGEPLRITEHPGFEGHPTWSPDGSTVAFIRDGAVWTVPGRGGEGRKLFDLGAWSFGLDWFPDGRSIVVSQPGDDGVQRLVRLFLDAPGSQPLTTPGPRLAGDFKPAVSPDGRWVAFVRGGQLGDQDVCVVGIEDGEARRLSQSGGRIRGVDWHPDGGSVIYATDLGGGFGLWRAAIAVQRSESLGDRQQTAWLPLNGQDIYNPVVAATGRLVFESISFQRNLWTVDLRIDPEGANAMRLPVHSTEQETAPALSPDGRQLAFVSNRSGQRSLWLSTIEGADLRLLTRPDEAVAAGSVWSPDGSRIAVSLVKDGYARPFVVAVESGRSRPLLDEPVHAIPVAWSRDGARIYLASDRSGQWDLWSIGVDGEELARLTTEGGLTASEDERGTLLYFTRPGDPTFYALPLQGDDGAGEHAARAVGQISSGNHLTWRLAASALYAVVPENEVFRLARLDLATGAVEEIARPPGLYDSPFALSPDVGRLIYSRVEESESDLMFIDGAL